MVTIGNAILPSDSDPEDEDYEGSEDEAAATTTAAGADDAAAGRSARKAARRAAEEAWADMQAEEARAAAARRRPPLAAADPLARELQRRHPRRPKDCSKQGVLAMLSKYGGAAPEDGRAAVPAAEWKRRVRAAAPAAEPAGPGAAAEAPSPAPSARAPGAASGRQELVRFAGQLLTVRRPGPAPTKRRRGNELGGQLAGLDKLLGSLGSTRDISVIEKSGLDWSDHREQAGLADLHRDARAGALDRRAFLERAAARSAARGEAATRAAARAKARAAARSEAGS
ncbi:unnamed protein product [Prorocentrum cordatum]|uniref:BCNT-C domain-containing protein n=1 Tax=Prorocentrum cordatum TaxID=2364126 RepID=A0ABN9URA3_9DINO|nr:unnamed protein product [Polarella glacialis]